MIISRRTQKKGLPITDRLPLNKKKKFNTVAVGWTQRLRIKKATSNRLSFRHIKFCTISADKFLSLVISQFFISETVLLVLILMVKITLQFFVEYGMNTRIL